MTTEGKQREYLNEWSLCCSLTVLKIRGQERSVCNLGPKHPASTPKRKVNQTSWQTHVKDVV